jgi:hypothetical protein
MRYEHDAMRILLVSALGTLAKAPALAPVFKQTLEAVWNLDYAVLQGSVGVRDQDLDAREAELLKMLPENLRPPNIKPQKQ